MADDLPDDLQQIEAQAWFCEVQSPWRKGSAENADKSRCRWSCHDTDRNGPLEELCQLCTGLNTIRCGGTDFPARAQVFKIHVLGLGHRRENL